VGGGAVASSPPSAAPRMGWRRRALRRRRGAGDRLLPTSCASCRRAPCGWSSRGCRNLMGKRTSGGGVHVVERVEIRSRVDPRNVRRQLRRPTWDAHSDTRTQAFPIFVL
jgi:hypothetical protein